MSADSQRRLAAIVSADVVGYARLMGEDETGTLAALRAHRRQLIDPLIARHGGRIVKTMGDGILLEFADAIDATLCAIGIQQGMLTRNAEVPEDRRIVFRIGINLSDVIIEGDDILGDGVNLAARLEGMAEPGGLLVSHSVYERIADEAEFEFADNGERAFKNIVNPVRVWSWPRLLPTDRPDRKPFVVIAEFHGRSEDERGLADDLSDELVAALSRLTGLEVTLDRRKADYIVQGAVRLSRNRCRLSVQLISVDDEKQLWAERYDENSDEPFDVLDRCVPRIAMIVRRRIASDDAARSVGMDFDQMTFEQLLSAAGVSFFTPTKEGWLQGGRIAELALERDATNFMALAMAAAGLGMAEFLYGYRRPENTVVDDAFLRLDIARRQTNESDMLLCVYSGMLLYARGRYDEAITAAERSLELNPEYNMGLWCLGAAQAFAGNYHDAVSSATRAVDVNIRDPYVHLYSRITGYGHFGAKNYSHATEWFGKADQLAPHLPHNLIGLAASRWHGQDEQGARAAVAQLLETESTFRIADLIILPFRDREVWDRLLTGLRAAGAPD